MPRVAVVTVHSEVLGHRVGLWCNRCLLPSAVRAWVALTAGARTSLLVRDQCRDCGSHDVDDAA